MAEAIAKKINAQEGKRREMKNTTIEMHRVPLALSGLQPKVFHDWRLRPWLFRGAFGQYPAFISARAADRRYCFTGYFLRFLGRV